MHCFVTGITSGIGKAVAEMALQQGWAVSGCARRSKPLVQLCENHPSITGAVADVADRSALVAAMEKAVAQHGPIHAVIANAGHGMDGELATMPLADLEHVFRTNVFGVHNTVQCALPHCADKPRFVLVASVASWLAIPRMGAIAQRKQLLIATPRPCVWNYMIRVCAYVPVIRERFVLIFLMRLPKPGRYGLGAPDER